MYHIGTLLKQLTDDHTYVAREVLLERLTFEQIKTDKRHSLIGKVLVIISIVLSMCGILSI